MSAALPPVRVGLAGAGPWARAVHAPMLAAGPETTLAGVWSRHGERAAAVADDHGVPVFDSYDALLDAVDAVALAVVPAVQPVLAVAAAARGKALLLEKPLALDVAGAERIVDAVTANGVGSAMVLTYRYADVVREFLRDAADDTWHGGRACFLSGAFLGGAFAGGWRLELGAVSDIGPHILDLVDAALGPVTDLTAHGDPHTWVGVQCTHESGAWSEIAMSCASAVEPSRTEVELYGRSRSLAVDARAGARAESFARLRAEFAEVARTGAPHECDARRGLELQRLVARVESALAAP
ncbi:MAG: Gfo/Idh/MocA family protein [Acidimicrobiia bacterium]